MCLKVFVCFMLYNFEGHHSGDFYNCSLKDVIDIKENNSKNNNNTITAFITMNINIRPTSSILNLSFANNINLFFLFYSPFQFQLSISFLPLFSLSHHKHALCWKTYKLPLTELCLSSKLLTEPKKLLCAEKSLIIRKGKVMLK